LADAVHAPPTTPLTVEQVEEIARRQPETLALQVGQWMKKG
jgi:hypothetical protein